MRVRVRRTLFVVCLTVLVGAVGCDKPPSGPSLSAISVEALRLQATAGDANLCCCRVAGRVTNNNSVAVHLTMKFSAYDGRQADPVASIVYFIKDLQPRAVHTVDAAGLLVACSLVRDLKYEVEVRGLASPPE